MEIKELKQYIYDNNKVEDILIALGMGNIKGHDNDRYYTCSFPDGDNPNGCVVYNSDTLNVTAYTRNIVDMYNNSDLISLVSFVQNIYFYQSIKWLCDFLGLDYYKEDVQEVPRSVLLMRKLKALAKNGFDDEEQSNQPISEKILKYYYPYPNQKWIDEGINAETQRLFGVGIDVGSGRITIPIRDEINNLVGVKGRIYNNEDSDSKYMYLEKCNKSKLLYGLNITYPHIMEKREVIVVESEKSVMKLYSFGYPNAVAIGGHTLSKKQVTMLTRLGVKVVIAFDKDVKEKIVYGEIGKDTTVLAECYKFLNFVDVEYILDKDDLLDETESPADNYSKWTKLYNNNRYSFVR